MSSFLTSLVKPTDVRTMVRTIPEYVSTRERAAAVVHDGMKAKSWYDSWKPAIFATALTGTVVSSYMLWKRRKVSTETIVLWAASTAVCGTAAWVTRPTSRMPVSTGDSSYTNNEENKGIIGYIDRRVKALKEADKDFADKAITSFVETPSIKPRWDKTSPLVKALIL